jgi:rRNA maturation RNase YbeY
MAKNRKKEVPLPSLTEIIQFNFIDRSFRLQHIRALRYWIYSTIQEEGKGVAAISYNFCSDEFLLNMNREHLNHDYLTDIITFELHEKKQPLLGDVYISIDRVKDNSHIHGVSFHTEICRVLVHGALHLCGYGDKTKAEAKTMRSKEDYYLSLLDV